MRSIESIKLDRWFNRAFKIIFEQQELKSILQLTSQHLYTKASVMTQSKRQKVVLNNGQQNGLDIVN